MVGARVTTAGLTGLGEQSVRDRNLGLGLDPVSSPWWSALEHRCRGVGLHIVRPMQQEAIDGVDAGLPLTAILPGAQSAILLGDGGRDFFAGFTASTAESAEERMTPADPDPLDRYTRTVVARLLDEGGFGGNCRVLFPFDDPPEPAPRLSFQRLVVAAGLPPAGPLGLSVHPGFGPWWAIRAVVVTTAALPVLPALTASCPGCAAPCVTACPAAAVAFSTFRLSTCGDFRLAQPRCHHACAARSACVIAPDHAQSPGQMAFHMAASLRSIRRYRALVP